MGQVERGHESVFKIARDKWSNYLRQLSKGDCPPLFLTFSETAAILGISALDLRGCQKGRMGLNFTEAGVYFQFTPDQNLLAGAYRTATGLLQLAVAGQAEGYLKTLKESEQAKLKTLSEGVPELADLIESVRSGATAGDKAETTWQHARMASWYQALPAGYRVNLVPPDKIFTTPG